MLDAAWPTIAAALPRFLTGPNDRLQTVCEALSFFLEFTGRWDEWLAFERDAESRAVAVKDLLRAGWRAYDVGWVNYLRAQSAEVLACADRAETYWHQAEAGTQERAVAIRLHGIAYELAKDYPAAIIAFRQALELDRTLGHESRNVATGLSNLADVEAQSGYLDAAERDYREALRIARIVDYGEGVAYVTGNLTMVALVRQDWLGAEALARDALSLSERVGRQQLIASNSWRLARALLQQGKKAGALPHIQRAIDIYSKLGSPDLAIARKTLAECES
jgi:tetratricopeptide (TPR) repeat protein